MDQFFSFNIDEQGVAHLNLNLLDEKVNKLTSDLLFTFEKLLDKISSNQTIKFLLIKSGKVDNFIAGADVNEIKAITTEDEALQKLIQGHTIFNKLENLPFPTICVIHGSCLGAGLELALACNYRIATDHPKTILGLPEVNLGIIPGFGGTQRLPRLIGLANSLKLIMTGKLVSAKEAFKMKIVDALVPHEFLDIKTTEFIQSIQNKSFQRQVLKRRDKKIFVQRLLESFAGRWLIFFKAKKDLLKKTRGNYPAPLETLKVIRKTYKTSLTKGLKREAQTFSRLVITEVSKNLSNLFFVQEKLKKEEWGVEGVDKKEIQSAGVTGAGVMGGGIAWLFSMYNLPVQMKDINYEAIGKGLSQARAFYNQLKKRKKISEREINLKMHQMSGTLDYSGFRNHDIVIEAVSENISLKKKILSELENEIKKNAILTTNTSSLSIDELAKDLQYTERFAGMHFFNPVNRMPLVEIIAGKKTAKETISSIVSLTRSLNKTPIVVNNGPGFLVNRILMPYLNESVMLFEEGAEYSYIDKIFLNFGMPMGPFTLMDEIGIDVGFKVAQVLTDAFKERMSLGNSYKFLLENNFYGKKNGIGFYIHLRNKKKINKKIVQQFHRKRSMIKQDEIIERTIFLMINEAAYCLDEKIIEQPLYLDMALILGLGFPPFRGGLLNYADKVKPAYIVERLEHYEELYGSRFKPSKLLKELATRNSYFYEMSTIEYKKI
jgi:3-hydroxyacyl-CoA dehydrogenase/enoyl-CoA hydratase/3-hydroxybutyryl-CoA epimerase